MVRVSDPNSSIVCMTFFMASIPEELRICFTHHTLTADVLLDQHHPCTTTASVTVNYEHQPDCTGLPASHLLSRGVIAAFLTILAVSAYCLNHFLARITVMKRQGIPWHTIEWISAVDMKAFINRRWIKTVALLGVIVISNGCDKAQHTDSAAIDDSCEVATGPFIPAAIPVRTYDEVSADRYRYVAAPFAKRPTKDGPIAEPVEVINKMLRLEFDAVIATPLAGATTGPLSGAGSLSNVAVRCNPLGPISHRVTSLPYASAFTFVPGDNVVYGNSYGKAWRKTLNTAAYESILDGVSDVGRMCFDSKTREIILHRSGGVTTRLNVDNDSTKEIDKAKFPSIWYFLAYDSSSERYLKVDVAQHGMERTEVTLQELDETGKTVATRSIAASVPIHLDKQDAWRSTYDSVVVDEYMILLVRRSPEYDGRESRNFCHVIDLTQDQVVFSSELVAQPASDPRAADDSVALSDAAAFTEASVGGRYQDLITKIAAPTDVEFHSAFRNFGKYTGTQWRGYDLPKGYYVYVYPNWYVWRTSVEANTAPQSTRYAPPPNAGADETTIDPRLMAADAALKSGKDDAALKLWEEMLTDESNPTVMCQAMMARANYAARSETLAGAIRRLEPLGRNVMGQPGGVSVDIPANSISAQILMLLRDLHAELGQYKQAAVYADAVKGSYFNTCGTYQGMYENAANQDAEQLLKYAEANEYRPSPRFTEMLNGMTIANGGTAREPVLRQLSSVRRLYFWNAALKDDGAKFIESLIDLTGLVTSKTELTDRGFESISRLRKLTELAVPDAKITDAGALCLSNMPELQVLQLTYPPLTNRSAKTLGSLKCLRQLDIMHTRLTDDGLKELSGLTRLEYFKFPYQTVTGKGLQYLRRMTRLKEIYIEQPSIDPLDMTALSHLTGLEKVQIHTRSGAGEGLRHLASLPNLKQLYLGDPTIKSRHLKSLSGVQVELLSLWGSAVDDACVDFLLTMHALKTIHANGLRELSPTGIRKLKAHPTLKSVSLTQYCIPEDDRKPLTEDMKPVTINWSAN